jgi:membrane associated rhomboid family serine protease
MLLVPYKADVDLGRWPVLTLLVCCVCIWVFTRQVYSEHKYEEAIGNYCDNRITREEQIAFRYVQSGAEQHYCQVLLAIRAAPDRKQAMHDIAEAARPTSFYRNKSDSAAYLYSVLESSSQRFELAVPENLTNELRFDPANPTLASMLTAAFSHGSWWHLISNLIFFFAFAASMEVITGYFYYLVFILFAVIGTHIAYTYSVRDVQDALPTVGLSGVVMATMAFLATVVPSLRVRCFFWFIIIFRTFRIPALAIAGLYILQNFYDYTHRDAEDHINYIAHLSGAAIGIAAGLLYRFRHGEYLRELIPNAYST